MRVVIVGGSTGIGLATARALAALGAELVIASRSAEHLEQALREIGGAAQARVLDATLEPEVKRFFDQVGPFDHLVTTIGSGVRGTFVELGAAGLRAAFDGKFWGQVHCARHAVPHLSERGSITLCSGTASRRSGRGMVAAAAVNSALEGLGRALAVELAPRRVNVVSPGVVVTPIHASMGEERRQELYRSQAARLPVGRVGQPEDVASAIVHLIQNGFMTGSVIDVDGGTMVS